MITISPNKNAYSGSRNLKIVKYIVIHYTAGNGDTAKNEGLYFKNVNKRKAGAHFFIGQDGTIVKSVPITKIANAVGGNKYPNTKGGKYYRECTNANSVSIELCDNLTKDPSKKQIKAIKKTLRYILKKCPNATHVIRHYDVTGKLCPTRMIDNKKWQKFTEGLLND